MNYFKRKKLTKRYLEQAPISWILQELINRYYETIKKLLRKKMNEALKEALKEFFRVVLLAIIPVLISQLESGLIDWRSIAVVAGVAGLRFLDKFLHETGKETENENMKKGLTRF